MFDMLICQEINTTIHVTNNEKEKTTTKKINLNNKNNY